MKVLIILTVMIVFQCIGLSNNHLEHFKTKQTRTQRVDF